MQSQKRSKDVKMDTEELMGQDMNDLLAELRKMNRFLKAQVSLPNTFVRGVISGLGSVIGATIVLGFVVGFVAWIMVALVQVPILGDFVKDQTPVEVTVGE